MFSPLSRHINLIEHHTETPPGVVVCSCPHHRRKHKKTVVQDELKAMLKNGIIKQSQSFWSSPMVLVPKTNRSVHFYVDFRKVEIKEKFKNAPWVAKPVSHFLISHECQKILHCVQISSSQNLFLLKTFTVTSKVIRWIIIFFYSVISCHSKSKNGGGHMHGWREKCVYQIVCFSQSVFISLKTAVVILPVKML